MGKLEKDFSTCWTLYGQNFSRKEVIDKTGVAVKRSLEPEAKFSVF